MTPLPKNLGCVSALLSPGPAASWRDALCKLEYKGTDSLAKEGYPLAEDGKKRPEHRGHQDDEYRSYPQSCGAKGGYEVWSAPGVSECVLELPARKVESWPLTEPIG